MPSSAVTSNQLPATETAHPACPLFLLADDLTGACDAAAPFLHAGHAVRVWVGASAAFPAAEPVQAFNTASRELGPPEAADLLLRTVAALPTMSGRRIFKKIDSALRGPIAAEVLAVHRALGTQAILFTPAFPAAGRTVRAGVLEIRDSTGEPARLVLRDLFPAELQPQIAIVSTAGHLASALTAGKSLLLCDASTQDDLDALAHAAQSLTGLLYAGSAGLAAAMASLATQQIPYAPFPTVQRALIIAGTTHPVTALQLERLSIAQPAPTSPAVRVLRIPCDPADAALIRDTLASFDPQALLLTGGETALFVARTLGAHSILLRGEVAPGIPWGIAQGGSLQDRIVITKSGGFGAPDLLQQLFAAPTGCA